VSDPFPDAKQRHGYSIAIGLFVPAIVWFLHLFTVSVVAEWGQFSGLSQRRFLSFSVVSWIIFFVSLAAIAATIVSLSRVAHFDRHLRPTAENRKDSESADDFLERVAIYSGLIFLVVTSAQTLPLLLFIGGG
jgi:hypothetical protein